LILINKIDLQHLIRIMLNEYERQTTYIIIEMFYELVRNRHFDVADSILAKWNIKEKNNITNKVILFNNFIRIKSWVYISPR